MLSVHESDLKNSEYEVEKSGNSPMAYLINFLQLCTCTNDQTPKTTEISGSKFREKENKTKGRKIKKHLIDQKASCHFVCIVGTVNWS